MDVDRQREAVTAQYAKLARNYDARWSHYLRATTDATVARLPLAPGAVLDVGCGTGALLARVASEFPASHLAGIDASPEMLAIARSRLPADIALRQSWATDLPFEEGSFDTVVSCNMFHFIRRPSAALDEMLRVLRPHGTLVITDWCHDFVSCKLCELYLRWFDPSHFRMYSVAQFRALLTAAQARDVRIDKYKITWLWGLMTATARKGPPATAKDSRA